MTKVHIPEGKHAALYVFEELAPALGPAANGFSAAVYEHSSLPLGEFEAARFRIAQINSCLLCLNWRTEKEGQPLDEHFYSQIENWRESPELTPREKLAAEYAERFALRHLDMDEEFWARMKAEFVDEEIADLSLCLAMWLGLGRVNNVLGIDKACTL